jgi:molybdate transport system substrate-binding protein
MSGKRLWAFFTVALLAISLAAGCGTALPNSSTTSVQPIELNVAAAVSMKDTLTEIQQNYQRIKPQIRINYNLASSGALQKQIEQGAPADLFISAAARQMDELAAKNLINQQTRRNLVENQLVMIAPKDSTLDLQKFEDIANNRVKKFAMGEPETVPAGQYAQQVLRKLNLWDITKDKAVLAKDVRTVLTYVETGNVEAGLVYRTDAAVSDKVQIVTAAPGGSHQPIVYPAAVLTGAQQTKEAEEFLAYLSSPEAQTIFEKNGFRMSK